MALRLPTTIVWIALALPASPLQAQSISRPPSTDGFNAPVANIVPPADGLEKPIGRVVSVSGTAVIEHPAGLVVQANVASGPAQARLGDQVYRGDIAQTGVDGKLGVAFTDGTAFDLSPNARMVLNEFVYNPSAKSNAALFSLTKGSFTFVAGQVAKTGDLKVDTPVATMGIRGTTPRVEIAEDGSVAFSTLVEEDKVGLQRRRPGSRPAIERRADRDKPFNLDMRLCRGC